MFIYFCFGYFPDGIDVYFDNVGGEMLEAAVSNMNLHERVAVCGVISEYTNTEKHAAPDMLNVILYGLVSRISLYNHIDHIRTGKMHVLEDVSIGLESVPSAFVGLYSGYNVGKKIEKVADE
ncbi:alcohol dehydrogenase superfamily, zinc-type [Artemisia annua]|uniref:Alcohol dehydrogenase superfamily, zinc-type n=1 Tax=Artemisia annua TaxID=35608 RepID=A0A2U1PMZ3_ARTAN|nr:alcohol dehydrogenase superfamily, zinc-type [Artemisia annua]